MYRATPPSCPMSFSASGSEVPESALATAFAEAGPRQARPGKEEGASRRGASGYVAPSSPCSARGRSVLDAPRRPTPLAGASRRGASGYVAPSSPCSARGRGEPMPRGRATVARRGCLAGALPPKRSPGRGVGAWRRVEESVRLRRPRWPKRGSKAAAVAAARLVIGCPFVSGSLMRFADGGGGGRAGPQRRGPGESAWPARESCTAPRRCRPSESRWRHPRCR